MGTFDSAVDSHRSSNALPRTHTYTEKKVQARRRD